MLLYKDIIKEENPVLKEKSVDVVIPLSDEDKNTIHLMNEYLESGYDDELIKKYDIRPGVGLAAPQLGILKKIFVICSYDELGNFHHFACINPKIVSHSVELAYLPKGEGCLSVDRDVCGLIHRPRKVTIDGYFYDFETATLVKEKRKFSKYLAIVVQHEYDHLYGIMFYDHINTKHPYYVPDNSTPIVFEGEK